MKMTEYPETTKLNDSDIFITDGSAGTKKITMKSLTDLIKKAVGLSESSSELETITAIQNGDTVQLIRAKKEVQMSFQAFADAVNKQNDVDIETLKTLLDSAEKSLNDLDELIGEAKNDIGDLKSLQDDVDTIKKELDNLGTPESVDLSALTASINANQKAIGDLTDLSTNYMGQTSTSINKLTSAVDSTGDDVSEIKEALGLDVDDSKTFYDKTEVNNKIKDAVSSVYKYKGSIEFYNLPTENVESGDVYNIKDDFTANETFILSEIGKTYPAGTNIAYTSDGWDVLSGVYDFSELEEKVDSNSDNITRIQNEALLTSTSIDALRTAINNEVTYTHGPLEGRLGEINSQLSFTTSRANSNWSEIESLKSLTYTKTQTDNKISSAISGVYKYKGSVEIANLPTDNLTAGDTYNIKDDFTANETFIMDEIGKQYPAGTNVSWTDDGWDVLSGIYDFSELETAVQANTTFRENVNTLTTEGINQNVGIVVSTNTGNYSTARFNKANETIGKLMSQASDITPNSEMGKRFKIIGIDIQSSQMKSAPFGYLPPFKFGIDSNGNYGYYEDGADSVTPFKKDLVMKINTELYDNSGIPLDLSAEIAPVFTSVTQSVFFITPKYKNTRPNIVGINTSQTYGNVRNPIDYSSLTSNQHTLLDEYIKLLGGDDKVCIYNISAYLYPGKIYAFYEDDSYTIVHGLILDAAKQVTFI